MGRTTLVAAAAAVVLVVVVVGVSSGVIVDAIWFRHLGYAVVFRTMLGARLACFAVGALVTFAVVSGCGLYAARQLRDRGVVRVVLRRGNGAETLPELIAPFTGRIPWRGIVIGAAALIALLFGLSQAAGWQRYLLWIYGEPVGAVDPFFHRDFGFYLFALPAYRSLVNAALGIVVLSAIVAGALFWLHGTVDLRRPGDPLPPAAIRLGSVLLGVFLLVKGADYWLGRYELVLAPYGAVYGAGYTVSHVKVPLQWLMCLAALAGAAVSFVNARTQGWQLPVTAMVALFAVSVLTAAVPDLYQRLRVRPDEQRLEAPYLANNIALTRRAYGLDKIQERQFPAKTPLDAAAVKRNEPTFRNIRLWDPDPLLATYKQLQVIRLYYDFHDIDVDRYDLTSGRRQVMLSAREIVPGLLPANARTWVNQRLQFTHGFGAVMSPVTEFQGEGLPLFFLHDIPPSSPVGLRLEQPRIYFGERTDDYVVVGAGADEFDFPKGDENVGYRYEGRGGIRIGSWLRRAVFAWHFGDVNLLISGSLHSDSALLFRRSIRQRLSRLAPFLELDRDPYAVVANGRIYWVQDAYTTSSTFPYSEPVPGAGFNYIRNSVKAVIDAYDGTVTLYATDEKEPILAAYARMFPGMFRPIAEMPAELRSHVRYPEDLFLIQAEMYRTYHMTTPEVFYNKEDLWSFPTESAGGTRSAVQPYYIIMKLPGGDREEFLLMEPMTPSNRSNMVAWLAARCDDPAYGELIEYAFPKDRVIYGPQQIEARIDQDTTISQQLSLWNQMGSKVIRGNLLVIPVEDSIVYVEPLYLRSDQGQIPELKRVIVAYGDRVAMEATLEEALAKVFGGAPLPIPAAARTERPAPAAPPAAEAGFGEARDHYRAALEALRAGDWAKFGAEMDSLGKTLGK